MSVERFDAGGIRPPSGLCCGGFEPGVRPAEAFVDDKHLGPAANFGMSRSYALAAGDHTVTRREPASHKAPASAWTLHGEDRARERRESSKLST